MLGIKELDRIVKRGLVMLQVETSFPYEALVRRILSGDSTLVYLDGPAELGERLFGKRPITTLKSLVREPPERPVIVSLTSAYYDPARAGLSRPEELFFFLGFARNAYADSMAVALIHFDAVPEKFSNLLEIHADVALRIHPMGDRAVAIIRRHPRPNMIGETVEFGVRYVPGAHRRDTPRSQAHRRTNRVVAREAPGIA